MQTSAQPGTQPDQVALTSAGDFEQKDEQHQQLQQQLQQQQQQLQQMQQQLQQLQQHQQFQQPPMPPPQHNVVYYNPAHSPLGPAPPFNNKYGSDFMGRVALALGVTMICVGVLSYGAASVAIVYWAWLSATGAGYWCGSVVSSALTL